MLCKRLIAEGKSVDSEQLADDSFDLKKLLA